MAPSAVSGRDAINSMKFDSIVLILLTCGWWTWGAQSGRARARHAALGDPVRLAIVDELEASDRAAVELQERLGIPSNLLAHHLDVLQAAGLISRSRSSGDGRRRYLHLRREAFTGLVPERRLDLGSVLFVCTANSARSQLAAALWRQLVDAPAESAGTHPADRVHPGAIAAARPGRIGPQPGATPTARPGATACRAHGHHGLRPGARGARSAAQLVALVEFPTPFRSPRQERSNATVADLRERIGAMVDPAQVLGMSDLARLPGNRDGTPSSRPRAAPRGRGARAPVC